MKVVKYIAVSLAIGAVAFLCIGIFVPAFTYQSTVTVNAPVEKAFEVFLDSTKMKDWMPNFKSIEMISGKLHEVGSVSQLIVVENGKEYIMTEKVTAFIPNSNYQFILDNEVMIVKSKIVFSHSGELTLITATDEVHGKNLFWRSLFPFFKTIFRDNAQQIYDNLKLVIEKS